jgi:uncharacterized phage protein (TIGR01671 family)
MTRVIKFRAWDKNNNKIVYPDGGVCTESNGALVDWFEDEDLMQFTNILDKNNRDIYEKDIVEFYQCKNAAGEVWLSKHGGVCRFRGVYGFENGAFTIQDSVCISDEIPCSYQEVEQKYGGVEVVGNVYENPELLVAKN